MHPPPLRNSSIRGNVSQAITMLKIIVSVLLSLSFVSSSALAQDAKYRVAVSDLIVSEAIPAKQQEIVRKSSLISDVENAIRNGRKFELLTRRAAHLQAIRKEQEFAQSDLAAGDAANKGEFSNAQSLVQIEVLDFNFGRSASKVPNISNKYKVQDGARIELSVQIIDTSKGTVVASFPIKASNFGGSFIANGVGSPSRAVLDKTFETVAGQLANQLSDTVFPITVLRVQGKKLFINRGNDSGLKVGEKFVVFEPGEELVDPQTGESLGSAETEVGECTVSRINPKFSVVDVTSGDPASFAAGFILRRPVANNKKK